MGNSNENCFENLMGKISWGSFYMNEGFYMNLTNEITVRERKCLLYHSTHTLLVEFVREGRSEHLGNLPTCRVRSGHSMI
jgi:hypothetical protein